MGLTIGITLFIFTLTQPRPPYKLPLLLVSFIKLIDYRSCNSPQNGDENKDYRKSPRGSLRVLYEGVCVHLDRVMTS